MTLKISLHVEVNWAWTKNASPDDEIAGAKLVCSWICFCFETDCCLGACRFDSEYGLFGKNADVCATWNELWNNAWYVEIHNLLVEMHRTKCRTQYGYHIDKNSI